MPRPPRQLSKRIALYNARQARGVILPQDALSDYDGLRAKPNSRAFYGAVKEFQIDKGLSVDGLFGPATQRALRNHYRLSRTTRAPKVTVWMGWGRPSRMQLEALRDAGCDEIVFNLNGAGARGEWSWNPSRKRTVKQIEMCKDLGFEIALMPWCWATPQFMRECAKQLRSITDEVGGVNRWEFDCEGSWELTFRQAMNGASRPLVKGREYTDRLVDHILNVRDDEVLSATVLYWKRSGGTHLIQHPDVTHVAVQAYSVWLKGKTKKAKSTHSKGFAPGVLQRTAINNYDDFKFANSIDHLCIGLGWWAQDRPSVWQMTRGEAIRKASDTCLSLGVDGVSAWAMHLWDDTKKQRERVYWDLAVDEIRHLKTAHEHHAVAYAGTFPDAQDASLQARPADVYAFPYLAGDGAVDIA